MVIRISPKRVFVLLLGVSVALVFLHIAGQVSRLEFGHARLYGLVALFNLEEESNIPSFWSSFLWLIAGTLAGLITCLARNAARYDWLHWLGLSIIFFLCGMDEIVQFHERLGSLFASVLRMEGIRATGFLYYVWIIPALLVALVLFFVYLRFMLRLPRGVMLLIAFAGTVFITGSVGFEVLEGPIDEAGEYMNFLYTAYVTCEESFEMAGVCILILALMRYVAGTWPSVQIALADSATFARRSSDGTPIR